MVERSSPVPLYHQLKALLSDRIGRGEWKPGDLIPTEAELQSKYALSRTTVRLALRELESDGLVARQRGRGTFVARPKLTHSPDPEHGLTTALDAQGSVAAWSILVAEWVEPPADVRERLQLPWGTRAYCLKRVRLANGEAIGVHVAHVAPAYSEAINLGALAHGSSLHYLEHHVAIQGGVAERLLDATPAGPEEATLLGIDLGAPMLRIRRLVMARNGQPIEDCRATYRGDRFRYHLRTSATAPDRNRE